MSPVESLVHGGSNELDPVASARAAVEGAFATIVGTTVDRVGTAPHEPSAEQWANGNGKPVTTFETAPNTNTPEVRPGVPKLVDVMQEVGPTVCGVREGAVDDPPMRNSLLQLKLNLQRADCKEHFY